jgi:DNA gyrase/topoisomerase IV subunit A
MPKSKSGHNSQRRPSELVSRGDLEELLAQQTSVILGAVDVKLTGLEQSFTNKLNELTTTLDKFLKRVTDIEDEFTFMKEDLKRVKAVLREKLGVTLD